MKTMSLRTRMQNSSFFGFKDVQQFETNLHATKQPLHNHAFTRRESLEQPAVSQINMTSETGKLPPGPAFHSEKVSITCAESSNTENRESLLRLQGRLQSEDITNKYTSSFDILSNANSSGQEIRLFMMPPTTADSVVINPYKPMAQFL